MLVDWLALNVDDVGRVLDEGVPTGVDDLTLDDDLALDDEPLETGGKPVLQSP